ncbi:MAG: hypothetical protein IJN96_05725, partial [Clostridia bacterium]|nr:hypothetical protein [Clostridia bacterium]
FEDFVAMKCREFATQIPCQNRVLTQENIENVFPHDAFIIIIVVETAECRFKRNAFRNFQAVSLKATHDCNSVGL